MFALRTRVRQVESKCSPRERNRQFPSKNRLFPSGERSDTRLFSSVRVYSRRIAMTKSRHLQRGNRFFRHGHPMGTAHISAAAPFSHTRVSGGKQRLQQSYHSDVCGVGRRIVLRNFLALRGRFQHERNACRSSVGEQPSKRVDANCALTNECVAVFVAAERMLAVVEMKERGRLVRCARKSVEHESLRGSRSGNVVATREEMAGI